jgi:hypothetical protein
MNDSPNYDESKVGTHLLPELLTCEDGRIVKDALEWTTRRRLEILRIFESEVYGKAPTTGFTINHKVTFTDNNALNGLAVRQEIQINLSANDDSMRIDLQLYTPKNIEQPVPIFLGCNFKGNHAVDPDPSIPINSRWMTDSIDGKSVVNNCATEFSRGSESSRWPIDQIIRSGFGLATFYYGDIEPDHVDGWSSGVRAEFSDQKAHEFRADHWGAIAAWSWGLRRACDYLTSNPLVDSKKIAVIGHSRLGKAALWAGALDERFAMVMSNNSGAGGISLARRNYGESIASINQNFPHWFCGNYKNYNDDPEKLPVDMHQLAALIAPRPLYIASAEDDVWADPKGEFLGGKFAEPAYALFDKPGLSVSEWPPVNHPVGEFIGYHIRRGKHDVTAYDWQQFIRFATMHFRKS